MREPAMQVRPALRQQASMRMCMRPSSGAGAGIAVVAEERRGYDHGSGQGYGNRLSSTGPGKPYNCVCRGLPGTGKTTSIKALFSEIDELTNRVLPVYVHVTINPSDPSDHRTLVMANVVSDAFSSEYRHYEEMCGVCIMVCRGVSGF